MTTNLHAELKLPATEEPTFVCECQSCGARGPMSNSPENAARVWNSRFSGRATQTSAEWRQYFREETTRAKSSQ